MLVKTLILLALSSIPVSSATGADIVTALQDLTNKWEMVSDALAVPPTTLAAALTVHNDLSLTQNATNTAIATVVNTGPFSEADGVLILPVFQNLCATVVPDATNKLIHDKPAFDALPIGGLPALLKQDLTSIDASTDNLADRLVANAPADLRNAFQSAGLLCEQLVHTCLAAYSA